MGTNKALIDIGGGSMLQRTAGLLRPLVDDLFIVAADPAPYADLGLPVLPDILPGRGALVGIHAALKQAAHPLVLCVACDMPHIAAGVPRLLLETAGSDDDALIPCTAGLPEPLLAVYGRGALPALERSIVAGRLRIMGALAGLRVRFVAESALLTADPARESFVNVNTPAELAVARAAAARGRR